MRRWERGALGDGVSERDDRSRRRARLDVTNKEPEHMRDYPDDAQRLTRLAEEVRGRLEEMAQIGARIGGIKLDPSSARKFVPRPAPPLASDAEASHGAVTMVEIFDATSGHPEMCVTWWSDGTVGLDSPCGHEIYHSSH
jgi:hypothetical protein